MGTSYRRNDFWVRLGGQTVVMIGRWCLRQPLTSYKERLVYANDPIRISSLPEDGGNIRLL